MNLRRTRKGWQEIPPKHCANGHPFAAGTVLVGTQYCETLRGTLVAIECRDYSRLPTSVRGRHAKNIDNLVLGARNRRDDRTGGRRLRFVQQQSAKRTFDRTEDHVRGGVAPSSVDNSVEGQW